MSALHRRSGNILQHRNGDKKDMTEKKRAILIGIAVLLLAFAVGWMVYSQSYKKVSISQKDNTTIEETKNEEENKAEKETVEAASISDKESKGKKLQAPKNLLVMYSEEGAVISWKKVKGADGYIVFRKGKDGQLKQLVQVEINTYTDKTVKEQTAYRYRVCAVINSSEGMVRGKMTKGVAYFHAQIDPDKPMVALTFDDGPSIYTPEILKTLKKYHARATFFIVGERVSSYASTIKQASKQGCEIGSHSYSHANLGLAGTAAIKKELNKTEKKVKDVLGFHTPVMRPPYGSIGDDLRKLVGKPMILWSIDTLDWKTRNAKSTEKKIMSTVKDGDIILMHDLYSQSRDAAKKVIPKLIKKGYQLVTVSEMAQYKGFVMKAGKAYTDMKNGKKK